MAIAEEKRGKEGLGQCDPNFVMYMCHFFLLFPSNKDLSTDRCPNVNKP